MKPCCTIERNDALAELEALTVANDHRSRYFVELPDGRRLPAKRSYCHLTGKLPAVTHPGEPLRYFARIGLTVGKN